MTLPKSPDEEIIEKVKLVMTEGNPSVGINWVLKKHFETDDRNKADQIAWQMLANGEYIINPKPHSEDDIFVVKNPNYKKQILDLKIAERIVKTYRSTQIIAWSSFAIAVILLFLKLAEATKTWPYNR